MVHCSYGPGYLWASTKLGYSTHMGHNVNKSEVDIGVDIGLEVMRISDSTIIQVQVAPVVLTFPVAPVSQ